MQVVAPVRETCAQTIGVILKHTDAESVKRVMMVLLTLQAQEEWEVRHGGLMGLKYLMAVRQVRTVNVVAFNQITRKFSHHSSWKITIMLVTKKIFYE